jgi:hypothetical protein
VSTLERAIAIATEAHEGKADKAGAYEREEAELPTPDAS